MNRGLPHGTDRFPLTLSRVIVLVPLCSRIAAGLSYFFFSFFNAASFSMYLAFSVRRFASARSSLGVLLVAPGGRPTAISTLSKERYFYHIHQRMYHVAQVLMQTPDMLFPVPKGSERRERRLHRETHLSVICPVLASCPAPVSRSLKRDSRGLLWSRIAGTSSHSSACKSFAHPSRGIASSCGMLAPGSCSNATTAVPRHVPFLGYGTNLVVGDGGIARWSW